MPDILKEFFDNVVKKDIKGAKIKFKNESIFMKVMSVLLFFNKDFMSNYTTVIGNTVYFPSKEWLEKSKHKAVKILSHEYVHMVDRDTHTLFSVKYLFPQILALGALLSFFSLWFLLFLIFAAPLPAPWRTYFEVRGYAMNMLFEQHLAPIGYNARTAAGRHAKRFTTAAYYFMAYRKDPVVDKLTKSFATLPGKHRAFIGVVAWLKTQKL